MSSTHVFVFVIKIHLREKKSPSNKPWPKSCTQTSDFLLLVSAGKELTGYLVLARGCTGVGGVQTCRRISSEAAREYVYMHNELPVTRDNLVASTTSMDGNCVCLCVCVSSCEFPPNSAAQICFNIINHRPVHCGKAISQTQFKNNRYEEPIAITITAYLDDEGFGNRLKNGGRSRAKIPLASIH